MDLVSKKNYKEAVKYYKMASNHAHFYATLNLAWMYGHGQGVRTNYTKAAEYFKKCFDRC